MAADMVTYGRDLDSSSNKVADTISHAEERSSKECAEVLDEGGRAGWAAVAGVFLIQFCGFGLTTSFGVYQDFYTRIYLTNESASTIAWIGSMNAFLFSSCGVVAGRLYDRGYFYHLIYGGSLLMSFSLFMLSFAKPNQFYQVFLTQGLGTGIAAGIMYVPSVSVLSHHFHSRRAMAMSFAATGSSLGTIVHPIMLNNTLHGSLGFANASRISAGMISILLLTACIMIRTGTPPSNQPVLEMRKCLYKFSKDKPYVMSTIGTLIFFVAYYFPLFYLQLDAISHGLSQHFAFYSLVILSFASFWGRLAAGFAVRSIGVGNLIVLSTFCCSAITFSIGGLAGVGSVVVIAALYGFFAGIYLALLAPMFAMLTDDMNELGFRIGFGVAVSSIGDLIGPPIHGAILGKDYLWWAGGLFNGIVSLVGMSFYVAMIVLRRRSRPAVTWRS